MYLVLKIVNVNTHLLALLDPEPGILFLHSSRMPSPYMFLRLYLKLIYLTFLIISNLYFKFYLFNILSIFKLILLLFYHFCLC